MSHLQRIAKPRFTEVGFMNAQIVLGLFAFYVAVISLCQVLAGRQELVLAFLRRSMGRTRGLALFFLANVALPMLICVLCLGIGVRHYDAGASYGVLEAPLDLGVEAFRAALPELRMEMPAVLHGAVLGA